MDKATRTKNFIVEKTAKLFNVQGYAGTSISDITSATGLTKGSVYGNFTNKEEVALAAFDYNVNRVFQGLRKTQLADNSALQNLTALFNFHVDHWSDIALNGGCPLLNAAVESDDNLPFLKGVVQHSFILWANRIAFIIEDGIKKGEFKGAIDSQYYAYTFVMLIQGGVLLTKITNDAKHISTAVERIQQIIKEEVTV